VNRTPITGELYAWTKKTKLRIMGCGCERCFEIDSGKQSIDLRVNIETPFMPITTDGKAPNIVPFVPLIREAASKAIRSAKRKSSLAPGAQQRKKDVILENLEAAIATASGDGRYRFSQRQLFYVIRPRFIDATGDAPEWNYFCQVVTNYENDNGEIAG